MKMSARVDRAVGELLEALQAAALDRQKVTDVVRCYRSVLPAVSTKTAVVLDAGHFTRRLLSLDPTTLPVSTTSIRRAIERLTFEQHHDPEWLGQTAERIAETLTVHFIDDVCEICQYDLGAYVTDDDQLVLRCRTDAHVWCSRTSPDGQLDLAGSWSGDAGRLRPATRGDLQQAGVAIDAGRTSF